MGPFQLQMVGRPAHLQKMFSILTDRLPDRITVDGEECLINTDFKRWIIFETVLTDGRIKDEDKLAVVLPVCLKKMPSSIERAVRACLDFYRGNDKKAEGNEPAGKPVYSFLYDADLIFSAFMSQYKIDLSTEDMHWYKFKALFKGLGADSKLAEVMQIRNLDLSEIKDREIKNRYRELKKIWQLPDLRSSEEKETEFAKTVGQLF